MIFGYSNSAASHICRQVLLHMASFSKKLEEQTQNSFARENAIRDSCQQRISALDSTVEKLSQTHL